MKARSTMVHVPMDAETKRKVTETLTADQAFRREIKVPNAVTRAAMDEVDAMVRTQQARFANADDLFQELEETDSV